MPRKKVKSVRLVKSTKTKQTKNTRALNSKKSLSKRFGTLSQFKWGESYTSFLLGVVVVIVGVLFGVTLVKQHKNIQDTSSIQITPSVAQSPTPGEMQMKDGNRVYTVKSGDDLWSVAEKFYQSGYNWVDIAKANNLTDPNTIHAGNELIIPSVTPDISTVIPAPSMQIAQNNSITGNTYIVKKDDDLWSIAVRAYGDGYKWVDIAKTNNLSNPNLIFSGNVLQISR